MSKFDNEYYLINSDGSNGAPLLDFYYEEEEPLFSYAKPIDPEEDGLDVPVLQVFSKIVKYPKKPRYVDAHTSKGGLVISERVYEKIAPFEPYGVQLFPAIIVDPKDKEIPGYYLMHIWNEIIAVDKDNYIGKAPDKYGHISGIEKFSLDEKVLSEIPLEKRLLFLLKESSSKRLVHQSVYDAIQSINPEGFFFRKVSEWNIGSFFE